MFFIDTKQAINKMHPHITQMQICNNCQKTNHFIIYYNTNTHAHQKNCNMEFKDPRTQ